MLTKKYHEKHRYHTWIVQCWQTDLPILTKIKLNSLNK